MSVAKIKGDLLESKEDYIVHQCNCYTITSHGLSKAIAEKFPWADHYSNRKRLDSRNLAVEEDRDEFGTIKIIQNPNKEKPDVVCLFAQLCPGKPLRFHSYPNWYVDTAKERLNKFKSCLRKLGRLCRGKNVAFPNKIGRGLAGGNWDVYYKLICKFANKYDVKTFIYEL